MGELRWILLLLGTLVLVGVYAYSKYRFNRPQRLEASARARREPSLDPASDIDDLADNTELAEPVVAEPPATEPEGPTMMVTLRLMSRDQGGFPGDKLVLAMRDAGLRHGHFGIFHAHAEDNPETTLFSVASLVEPGSFDLAALDEQRLPGVSLFALLPSASEAVDNFEDMLDTARKLATELEGELLDEHGSSLSVQRERYIRDEILQFLRENQVRVEASGVV
ncbi:MAG: cell division protein ZipA [Gammaproteobacteria bacterium]